MSRRRAYRSSSAPPLGPTAFARRIRRLRATLCSRKAGNYSSLRPLASRRRLTRARTARSAPTS